MADRTIKAIITASASGLISELNKASAATAKFGNDFSSSISKNEQSITTLANAAGGIGLGLAAGVGLAIKASADFDAQMSKVAASGEDARASLDDLRAAAIKAGADTAFSAVEAAQGVEELAKAGVSAADILGGGLKGALDLAAAGELSVGESAEIAASAMAQFKLKGEDVPHIADLLAAAAGKAQGSVHDMGAALNQSGLVAAQTGLTIEETTGTLAAFASAGLTGSDAGTAFKTMLQSLTPSSKEAEAAMAEMGFSAYDAQGNFRGMEEVSGLLREGLKDMSEEQRNATLKTIFGSDAVRAASVIYEQGSDGIGKWIDATNDAGFAAETAETKLDNLKGDIEQLGGSFETALIGLGESGQGPLREMVQGVTDLINKFNDLDSGTKGNILRIVASVAGLLIAVGTIGKLVVAGNEVLTAFKNITSAAPGASKAIGNVSRVATGAALGIGAFVLAVKLAGDQLYNGPMVKGAEQVEAALLKLSQTGDKTDIDKMFQVDADGIFNRNGKIIDSVDGLDDAITRFTQKDGGQQFNDFMSDVLSFTGVPNAYGDLKKAIGELDDEFAKMVSNGNGAKAAEALSKSIDLTKYSADQLFKAFPDYKAALTAQANELGVVNISAEEYAGWMGGKVPAAIERARIQQQKAATDTKKQGEALGETQDAAADYEKATTDLADAQKDLDARTKDLIDTFSILKGGTIDVEQATIDFDQAVLGLKGEVDKNTKSLEVNKDMSDKQKSATLANREAVISLIKQLDTKTQKVFEDTLKTKGLDAATKDASKSLEQGEEDIRAAGKAAGFSEKEIDKMVDEMVKTPKELKTEIEATNIKKVQDQIKTLENRIKDLESKTVDITTKFNVTGHWINAKSGEAYKIGNKTVTQWKHDGGEIQNLSGMGRKGADTEVVMAGVGEHMLTDREVDAIGGHDAVYRLRAAALRGELRGYKTGGEIRPSNLAGRPKSLAGRIGALHGRPDELEEIDLLNNLAGGKINPKPLMDYYAAEMSKLGGDLAAQMAKAYVKNAKESLFSYDGLPPGSFGKGTSSVGGSTGANSRRAAADVGPKFGFTSIGTYPGHDPSESRALDFMTKSKSQGDSAAAYMKASADRLNVMYLIWYRRIWSVARNSEGWRPYTRYGNTSNPSQAHTNHIHASFYAKGTNSARPGLAVVGEDGPELLHLRGGEKITPARQVIDHRFAPYLASAGTSYGSTQQGNGGSSLSVSIGNVGYDPDRLVRKIMTAQHDAQVAAGMTTAALA